MATFPCDGALQDPPNIHTSVRRRLELMQLILLPLTGALVQTKCGNSVAKAVYDHRIKNVCFDMGVRLQQDQKITEVRHFQGSSSKKFCSRKKVIRKIKNTRK